MTEVGAGMAEVGAGMAEIDGGEKLMVEKTGC